MRALPRVFALATCLGSAVANGASPPGTLGVVDVDLVVPAAAETEHRRAPYPSHRVFTGDEARIVATIRLGALRLVRPRVTFSTNAPLKGRHDEPRSGGVFIGPAGPRLFAGTAVFAAEGTYKVSVHVDQEGGPQTADATFVIEVAGPPAARPAPKPPTAPKPTATPAAAPTATPTPAPTSTPAPTATPTAVPPAAQPTEPSTPGVFGPDAAMIERLKIGIRQTAKKRPCAECGALLKRADALGRERDPAAALAEYEALVAAMARLQGSPAK